jgi:hypothetical protein
MLTSEAAKEMPQPPAQFLLNHGEILNGLELLMEANG